MRSVPGIKNLGDGGELFRGIVLRDEDPIVARGTTAAAALLQHPELDQPGGDLRDLRDMIAGEFTEFLAGGPAISVAVSERLQRRQHGKLRFAELTTPR